MRHLKYFESLSSFEDIKSDVKEVFQDVIDEYNIYEVSDTCKPGGRDDKSYYYSISHTSSGYDTKREILLLKLQSYNYRLEFITGNVIASVFIGAVSKDIKRLNKMGYKTKYVEYGDHIIDIFIKNKYN